MADQAGNLSSLSKGLSFNKEESGDEFESLTKDSSILSVQKRPLWLGYGLLAIFLLSIAAFVGFVSDKSTTTPLNGNPVVSPDLQITSVDSLPSTSVESVDSKQNLKTATVRMPWKTKPTKKFDIKMATDVRKYFPNEDIFIKSITFVGVEVDSKMIPFHLDAYVDEEETAIREDVMYTFHHTNLHLGVPGVSPNPQFKALFKIKFHENPAVVYGTHPHTTSFGEYGLRLRPDSILFSCMNVWNRSDKKKTFESIWNIEYELVGNEEQEKTRNSLKPILGGWFYSFLPNGAKVNEHYAWNITVQAQKDFKFVGFLCHHHPWLQKLEIFDNAGSSIWEHSKIPSIDGQYQYLSEPVEMLAGDTLTFSLHGSAAFKTDLKTPFALVFLTECADGSDHFQKGPTELYTVTHAKPVIME